MPLGLQLFGLNLRSASLIVAMLAMFFTGYRIVKDAVMLDVLVNIDIKGTSPDDDRYDYPLSQVSTLKKVLYGDVAFSGGMFLSSLLLMLGILKNIPVLLVWWSLFAVVFICVDLGVTIFLAVIYTNLSSIAWAIAINCIWYSLEVYFICVVIAYYRFLRGADGEGYHGIT